MNRAFLFKLLAGLLVFGPGVDGRFFAPSAFGAEIPVEHDPAGNLVAIGGGGNVTPRASGFSTITALPGTDLTLFGAGSTSAGRWRLNGVDVAGATTASLRIQSLNAANEGVYEFLALDGSDWVTNRAVHVWIDATQNGLGDRWEVTNFGATTNGVADSDGDGTSNSQEFLDGTSPTNRNDLRPRLTLYPIGGNIQVNPDLPVYLSNDLVTLTAMPSPGLTFVGWAGDMTGTTNPAALRMTGNRIVQANFGLPLAEALGTTNPVMSGGTGGWLGQANVLPDGRAAALAAPPLAGSGDAFLETTVTMSRDGTASFWWRVDGYSSSILRLVVDGSYDFYASRTLQGSTAWQSKTIYLASGAHKLRWIFTRDEGVLVPDNNHSLPADTAYVGALVLAEYSNPLLDTDGNGLPDLWEYRYFDGLGNRADADPDQDGVITRMELADGTDPNTKSSVKPRIGYVVEGEGAAAASPVADTYGYGQYVTNTASPAPGWQFVAWVGPFGNDYFFPKLNTNNPSSDRLYEAKIFKAIFGLPLGQAVESPALPWQTGGTIGWYGQRLVSWDGTNAARSGPLLDSQTQSWLETFVDGPGSISFWWKVDCAANGDYLTFLVNSNELVNRLSGKVDWQPMTLDLPAGRQTLRWLFQRNYGYDTNALNIAWLDHFHFTPGASKPEFVELPASLLGFPSSNLVFSVLARGTPIIGYQIWRDGVALSAPTTNAVLTITNVSSALSGNWVIRATNALGSADSAAIPVTILGVPANDDFANAATLSGGATTIRGDTFGATAQTGEPSHNSYSARSSVWYQWTAPFTGGVEATVSATNATHGLTLAVHQGAALNSLTELAGDTSYGQELDGIVVCQVTNRWLVKQGVKYLLAIDSADVGVFFDLGLEAMAPPVNDSFAGRLPLFGAYALVTGDNSLATAEPGEPALFSIPPIFYIAASNTLWWSWTAPASGVGIVQSLSDDIRPTLSVFTGNTLNSLVLLTNSFYGANPLQFNATRGVAYAISADSEQGRGGRFSFVVTMQTPSFRIAQTPGSHEVNLQLLGPPDTDMVLEFSPNLRAWYVLSTNHLDGDGVLLLPGIVTTNRSRAFYRAVAP